MIFASAPQSHLGSQVSSFSRAYTNPNFKTDNFNTFRTNPQSTIRVNNSDKLITKNNFCTVYEDKGRDPDLKIEKSKHRNQNSQIATETSKNKPKPRNLPKIPDKTPKQHGNRKQSYIYAVQNSQQSSMATIVSTRPQYLQETNNLDQVIPNISPVVQETSETDLITARNLIDSPYPMSQFTASTVIELPASSSVSPRPSGNQFGNELGNNGDIELMSFEISEACTRLINLETKSVIDTTSEEESDKTGEKTKTDKTGEKTVTKNVPKNVPKNYPNPVSKISLIRSCSQPEVPFKRSASEDVLRLNKRKNINPVKPTVTPKSTVIPKSKTNIQASTNQTAATTAAAPNSRTKVQQIQKLKNHIIFATHNRM